MLTNYVKIAWRKLVKRRNYALINIAGLTVGITACMLIGLFIAGELSYDHFQVNGDRIVRVTMEYDDGGSTDRTAVTGTKVGPQFARVFPEVEDYVRMINESGILSYQDRMFDEKHILYADSGFLKIFSFPLLEGDSHNALSAPGDILLTRQIARKYFGNADPLGKQLKLGTGQDFTVTGILAEAPDNSQIKYDMVASFSSLGEAKEEQWWTANYLTYLLLHQKDQVAPLQQKVTAYMKVISKNDLKLEGSDFLTYRLEPLQWVHLHSRLVGLEPNGSITTVFILGLIAGVILLVACINYTNLATAQSTTRSTEIGLRKVFGAARFQIFTQFIGEAFLFSAISLVLSGLLTILLLPEFNRVTGKTLNAGILHSPSVLLSAVLLGILISLASGAYPALVVSGAALTKTLRSGMRLTSSGGIFRKGLIIFQFTVSGFLIISTLVMAWQLKYIRHKDLGYDKSHILVLPVDPRMRQGYDDLKAAISTIPGVLSVSGAYETPTFVQWGDGITTGSPQVELSVNAMPVDLDFIRTMGMRILAGKDFTRADLNLLDTAQNHQNYHYTFMINETAARALGWSPQAALGKTLSKGYTGTVKAVIRDFNFSSLHQPIGPLVIFLSKQLVRQLFIKVNGSDIPGVLNSLHQLWIQRVPYRPFEYHFLDEDYNNLYSNDQRTDRVFALFSSLAIGLACLGLLALASYTTTLRTREIGIRRVLGSSISGIFRLISGGFLSQVIIAIVIASPLAWWAMNHWLDDFAYRIRMPVWVFPATALLALSLAGITVGIQAVRVARQNPLKNLKSE